MSFENLNDDNVIMYSIKAYDRPNFVLSDFEEDYQRIKYLQKLFNRYREKGDLKDRLILNHLIILNNVFGPVAVVRILFLKMPEEYHTVLKTFLIFLSLVPKVVHGIRGKDINTDSIPLDNRVIEVLRKV